MPKRLQHDAALAVRGVDPKGKTLRGGRAHFQDEEIVAGPIGREGRGEFGQFPFLFRLDAIENEAADRGRRWSFGPAPEIRRK